MKWKSKKKKSLITLDIFQNKNARKCKGNQFQGMRTYWVTKKTKNKIWLVKI